MEHSNKTVGQRFDDERTRLGLGVQETAAVCGVTRHAIGNIFRGAMPSGLVLQGFARAGADVSYVLNGERSGKIDLQLFGLSEAYLRAAYTNLTGSPADGRVIRPRMTAHVYNRVVGRVGASLDEDTALAEAARELLIPIDDPGERAVLENSLFYKDQNKETVGKQIVKGDGNRVAGRDMSTVEKESQKSKAKP